jgi:CheY-like chemotaxis protein
VARESILQGARVLLLEDEALINVGLIELLQSFGCEVTGCETPRHAWKAALSELPDVAVLDVNLQAEQTSYELAEWLHERHAPIVFLTGYSADELSERWRDHSVCEKPCRSDILQDYLIKALIAVASPPLSPQNE